MLFPLSFKDEVVSHYRFRVLAWYIAMRGGVEMHHHQNRKREGETMLKK